MSLRFHALLQIFLILNFIHNNLTTPCNEELCGSIVSKCLLTQSCKCEGKHVSCYKNCVRCMGEYFEDCCSCLHVCQKANSGHVKVKNSLSYNSHVEDFEGAPELFDIIVEAAAGKSEFSWNTVTFPVDYESVLYRSNLVTNKIDNEVDTLSVNCTVVYFDHCTSWNKCRQSCRSFGASSYRWFHDGCCECVGPTCLNYGVNESRCKHCPEVFYDEYDEEVVFEEFVGDDSLLYESDTEYDEDPEDNEI